MFCFVFWKIIQEIIVPQNFFFVEHFSHSCKKWRVTVKSARTLPDHSVQQDGAQGRGWLAGCLVSRPTWRQEYASPGPHSAGHRVHWIKQQHAAPSLGIYKCPLRWIVCEHVVPEVSSGSPENTSAGWKDTDLTEAIKSRALSYMEGKHSNTAPQEMMQDWRLSLASESEDWSVISDIKCNLSPFHDVMKRNLSFCIWITWTF